MGSLFKPLFYDSVHPKPVLSFGSSLYVFFFSPATGEVYQSTVAHAFGTVTCLLKNQSEEGRKT